MAKGTKTPAVPVDQLVRDALVKAAIADADSVKLKSAKGAADGLFPNGPAAAVKAAAEQCLAADPPLLASAGKQGKDEYARLAPAGLLHVLKDVPEETVGPAAVRIVDGVPNQQAIDFANEVITRVPSAVVELEPLVGRLVAKLELEAEERAKQQAARRERDKRVLEAMDRYKQVMAKRDANRIAEIKRELADLGGTEDPLPPRTERLVERPVDKAPRPIVPAPKDAREFVRQEARRLVSAWVEAVRLGKKEGQHFLEVALGNMSAMTQVAEVGDEVAFDPIHHECETAVSTGSPVRVVRPGWTLTEQDDREYVVAKVLVSPLGAGG